MGCLQHYKYLVRAFRKLTPLALSRLSFFIYFFYPFQKFRNQYDNDVTTWSPQGRLHQLEYAMEAVKQGSAAVGIKSATHAVMVSLKVV